ncbi:MAG: hypothetical protein PUH99_02620 [Firmicutes bacterium]|nr:hypothetical protein [Bacillota bacterium]MDY5531320.1 hypothetical protein [Pumilibacteraceae bacterium]
MEKSESVIGAAIAANEESVVVREGVMDAEKALVASVEDRFDSQGKTDEVYTGEQENGCPVDERADCPEKAEKNENVRDSEVGDKTGEEKNTESIPGDKTPTAEQFFACYYKAVAESERLREKLERAERGNDFSAMLKKPENAAIAASDKQVEKLVIENYLKNVSKGRAPEVVGGNIGVTAASETIVPKTLKEAKMLADMLFRN